MSRGDPGGNNSLRTAISTDSLALAACCEDGTPVTTKKSSIDSSHSTGSIPGENAPIVTSRSPGRARLLLPSDY
ncbi:hypothetical protein T03_12445 [Trichinella britovi]|uniref:Uncharacterized protein n=1 Tax=Trichinella britovi TaxID=45882 RepID=A0A0V0YZP0_TRIBR|nr:hypothetical protein T03_12445 [Trichinella britovi]